MLNIKKVCDYEAMAKVDWQKAIKEELGAWVSDWQYSLSFILIIIFCCL